MTQNEMKNFLLFVSDPELLTIEEAESILVKNGIDPEKELNELKQRLRKIEIKEQIEKGKKRQEKFNKLIDLSLIELKDLVKSLGLEEKYNESKLAFAHRNYTGGGDAEREKESFERSKLLLTLLADIESKEKI